MDKRLVVLLALVVAAPAMGQSSTDPEVKAVRLTLGGTAVSSVDLIDDHGQSIRLEVDAKDNDFGGEILLIEATLVGPTTFTLRLTPPASKAADGTETWSVTEPVDDPRLVTGDYLIALTVFDRNGGRTDCLPASGAVTCPRGTSVPALNVAVADLSSNLLSVAFHGLTATAGNYPDQVFGVSGALLTNVAIGDGTTNRGYLLKSVSYRLATASSTGIDTILRAPYRLTSTHFVEGDQDVTVTATDRAGRTASATVHVLLDSTPPAVDVTVPTTTYRNVTFAVDLDVTDELGTTAHVRVGNQTLSQEAAAGAAYTPFQLKRTSLENTTVIVHVIDEAGNEFLQNYNLTTVPATTDSTITVTKQEGYLLPGDNVTLDIRARQKSGVTTLPFEVDLRVDGVRTQTWLLNIPVASPREVTFERSFLPGIHTYNITIDAGIDVNETDDSDQAAVGQFEVFLGRVIHGDDTYYVRVGDDRLPLEAVSESGALYNLTLAERGARTVYVFTVGDEELYWDPLQRTTTFETDPVDEDAPGLYVGMLLVGLLAAVAVRRRI